MKTLALRFASANSDATPSRIDVVATTRPAAVRAVGADATSVDSDGSFFVVLTGQFVGEMAAVPPNAALPTGDQLYLMVRPSNMSVTDWGISGTPIDLASLGQEVEL